MAQTLEAWRAAETYVPHKVRYLGIANATRGIFEQLYDAAESKPAVISNRFHDGTRYDFNFRAFCSDR